MMATRDKPAAESKSEENLFMGLSFPDVPTAAVAVPDNAPPLSEGSLAEIPLTDLTELAPQPMVETKPQPAQRKLGSNLSALYSAEEEVHHKSPLYPELPSFNASEAPPSNSTSTYASTSYAPSASASASASISASSASMYMLPEEEESEYTESASLLPRTVCVAPLNGASAAPSTAGEVGEAGGELVTELVRENTRMADELRNLRRILEDQTAGVGVGTVGTAGAGTERTAGVGAGAMASVASAGTSVNGVQVSDTTQPPQKGVKYVCCGGCRQWLMAPREAVYVVCSKCEAINNCNLVPKDTHNTANDTRALSRPNQNHQNPLFWFLDCFTNQEI